MSRFKSIGVILIITIVDIILILKIGDVMLRFQNVGAISIPTTVDIILML
jgi:hypothetical protein